jgi:predicted acylesterase/phospholipase RssA
LKDTYTFKNIGGTSAGAIAAAATAAAEHRRRTTNSTAGFAELEQLPQWLGGTAPNGKESNLAALFQPQANTRAVFRTLTAGLGHKNGPIRILLAAPRHFPWAALAGALPGLILGGLALRADDELLRYWSLFCALVLIVVGSMASVGLVFVKRAMKAIPENCYGLCSGFAPPESDQAPHLTTWLSRLLNRVAGKAEDGPPLTFGELWGTSDPQAECAINLQMMTTNLTHGRPYRLPLQENTFYFDPKEFRRFFPEEVVKWMENRPRASPQPATEPNKSPHLCRLPATADLPVVVATRMSLSFPLLLSAIPLYAVDYSRKVDNAERVLERCWFSDGGLCSNFPVHFFDQSLPRWPTFAINLRSFHEDYSDQPVWMPSTNTGGIVDWWTRLEDAQGGGSVGRFLGAIVNATQNWMDNYQTRLPGYRDRVVHVSLRDNEGGLNLNMAPATIADVANRGRLAANELLNRFNAPPGTVELSWDNHRWVRYRSTMSLLNGALGRMSDAYHLPAQGSPAYEQLIRRPSGEPPTSYAWASLTQQQFASSETLRLFQMAKEWAEHQESFEAGAPRPKATLRITPDV